ncbi:unnamed protein product, partial [Mesorhabditis spiculigera]
MMGQPDGQWADKNMNITIMKDGQITTQADHSNVDAIVVLDAGNISGRKIRHHVWTPNDNVDFEKPTLIDFALDKTVEKAIEEAENNFYKHLAMQIAFRKVHGNYAPIYETASTRKFYLGRTETIKSRTPGAVAFTNALLESKPLAYDAHNKLMAEAMEGMGCDRHLYGLRKTLESMNKGSCSSKRAEPRDSSMISISEVIESSGELRTLANASNLSLTVDTALKPNATHKPGFKLFYKLDGMRRAAVQCNMLKVRPVGGPMSKLIVIDPRLFFDIPYRAFSLTHRWQDEGGFEWEKNEGDTDDYKMWITVRPYYSLKT